MYENDPNRFDRPRLGDPVESRAVTDAITIAFFVAAVIALALMLWPSERTATTITENAPSLQRPIVPADPPAIKPVTPSPTPPQ
jgi:hypothetical protein